ncbi:MAG: hypothetical protein IKO82_04130 [Prevotella sp.]|nr:hypothetical protein [Prevotella sp.]
MKKILFFCVSLLLTFPSAILAQDSLGTKITYDLSAETAVGTGDYTAYQLVTNRHHVLSSRPNTAYLRGAVNAEHAFTDDLRLSGAVDVIASVHADHKVYLQQAYMNLQYKKFFIEAGSREINPAVRDATLSVGLFTNGTNAKPVPQVRFGTDGFITVPYTKGWLQLDFDFGFGKFMDSDYRESHPFSDGSYTTGAYFHRKHLYFRSNPEKRFFGIIGIEHAVQFGGTRHYYDADGNLQSKTKPHNLKAFWKVILPLGDSNYFENNSMEDWVYGNHIGMMTYQIGWNINKHHTLQAYLDNIFEDGSAIRKGNGYDGLWGLQYTNKTPGRQLVRGAVFEYFQSTNQSGPLHWDPGDYPEPVRSQITETVTGRDDYYYHLFYGNYQHFGRTPGIALITPDNNRVKAWHLGVMGELTPRLSYLIKGSYREGWGTYTRPLHPKRHSFDAMVQGNYQMGPWQFSAAYAFDKGNVYGDCSTFNFKILYHGKIF